MVTLDEHLKGTTNASMQKRTLSIKASIMPLLLKNANLKATLIASSQSYLSDIYPIRNDGRETKKWNENEQDLRLCQENKSRLH